MLAAALLVAALLVDEQPEANLVTRGYQQMMHYSSNAGVASRELSKVLVLQCIVNMPQLLPAAFDCHLQILKNMFAANSKSMAEVTLSTLAWCCLLLAARTVASHVGPSCLQQQQQTAASKTTAATAADQQLQQALLQQQQRWQ
jgi:hypothetical protein